MPLWFPLTPLRCSAGACGRTKLLPIACVPFSSGCHGLITHCFAHVADISEISQLRNSILCKEIPNTALVSRGAQLSVIFVPHTRVYWNVPSTSGRIPLCLNRSYPFLSFKLQPKKSLTRVNDGFTSHSLLSVPLWYTHIVYSSEMMVPYFDM